ncbi:nucleotide cyclase [Dunaliella salina]|uniref:Nucleotide cyclase n=1 Tax=Dunaliella salina TaxID=3046 RepID=A0ABQ7G9J7_DUNSA|nr:nucleotide cyclase [Dunaliella salina]|eukprot:KAF5831279.1 nucleotide cyclase [Dunaliella salina]
MNLLGDLYKEYDERAVELGLYTVDHIGDCYMCAANLVKPLPDHVHVMVGFARNIIEIANTTLSPLGSPLSIRVGIHSGGLMSGVIGVHRRKFTLVSVESMCLQQHYLSLMHVHAAFWLLELWTNLSFFHSSVSVCP